MSKRKQSRRAKPAPVPSTATPTAFVVRDGTTGLATVTAEGLAMVERMARRGDELATIAKVLSLNPSAFRSVRQRQDEVQQAIDVGRAAFVDEMKDVLVEAARNGNVISAMFLLKTRGGWKEGEPTEQAQRANITIVLRGALTEDEYAARFKVVDGTTSPPPGLPAPRKVER